MASSADTQRVSAIMDLYPDSLLNSLQVMAMDPEQNLSNRIVVKVQALFCLLVEVLRSTQWLQKKAQVILRRVPHQSFPGGH